MSDQLGNFKKLIRNIRTKQNEKVRFIRNNAAVNDREESKKSEVQQKKNPYIRRKRDR
jgi:ribosome recycling factor